MSTEIRQILIFCAIVAVMGAGGLAYYGPTRAPVDCDATSRQFGAIAPIVTGCGWPKSDVRDLKN